MEIWKEIKGYEGLYEISSYGNVKSYHKNQTILLKQSKMKKGYMRVKLVDKNKNEYSPLVHVLVATAFIPNPENKPQVNHKDAIKWNNNVDNLEWNTQSENQKHARRLGLFGDINGENNNYHKLTEIEVLEIRSLQGKIKNVLIAELYGVTQQCICLIMNRKKWKHI